MNNIRKKIIGEIMGHQITELLLTVLIVMGIGKASEAVKPKQYYAILDSNKIMQVEISRFNRYACPKRCSIPHFHRVHICKEQDVNESELIKMLVQNKKELKPISIENQKIVDFIEIETEKKKKKKGRRMPIQLGKQLPWLN
ncbi:MAG: hypothetical protein CMF96_05910 [Candidatus Marinimicrobia bacterium]|nr:hypothetical protein [Candidatus Neomarinimicrobiota bacterium]|tara:strand:- start:14 stop:439 length:426 start_codon:yes stop_codon:yes gene_type:complete